MRLVSALLLAASACQAQHGERRAFHAALHDSDLMFQGGVPTKPFRLENVNLAETVHLEGVTDDSFDMTGWLDTTGISLCSGVNNEPQCSTVDSVHVVVEQYVDPNDDQWDGVEWVAYNALNMDLDGMHENVTISLARNCRRSTPMEGVVMHVHGTHEPIDGEEFKSSEGFFRTTCYGADEKVQRAVHADVVGLHTTTPLVQYGLVSRHVHADIPHSGYLVTEPSVDLLVHYQKRAEDNANMPDSQTFEATAVTDSTLVSASVSNTKAPQQTSHFVSPTQPVQLRVDFQCSETGDYAMLISLHGMSGYNDIHFKVLKRCYESELPIVDPEPEEGGMSGVEKFFLSVFIISMVLCLVGCGYKHQVKGARGVEVLPGIDHYRRVYGKIVGSNGLNDNVDTNDARYGYGSYQEI